MLNERQKGHLAMLVFSALVAGSFSLGSLASPHIAPTVLSTCRFWLAAVIVWGICTATGGIPRSAYAAPWRYLVLGGLFSIYFVLMFEGLKIAPPVSVSAVFTLTPPMAALFGWLILRQAMTARIATALALGAAGALWIIFRADIGALLSMDVGRGEAIYFVGCIAHAAYIPLVRRLNRGETTTVYTLGTLLAGAMVLTVWAWGDLWKTDWLNLPAIVWMTLGYITVFASVMTVLLIQFASLRLPAAKVMAYTYLTPAWVILWQVALGAAAPTLVVMAGLLPVVGALVLLLKD